MTLRLTPRLEEVAAMVAMGWSSKRIAKTLLTHDPRTGNKRCLSARTVDAYIVQIARKLPGAEKPRLKIMRWYFSTNQNAA
jgi:DNA-binding NarL/FixJ family response regulator